jgi:hypothetical protein
MTLRTVQELEQAIQPLDARLRPIAKGPVGALGLGQPQNIPTLAAAVDRAGVRDDAERALADAIDLYVVGDDADREAVRRLFRTYTSFRWAVRVPKGTMTAERLHDVLIVLSMHDCGPDYRDAMMAMDLYCNQARGAGLDVAGTLMAVAQLSSATNPSRRPSVDLSARKLLSDCAKRFERAP